MFTGCPHLLSFQFHFLGENHSGHENNGMSRQNKTDKWLINARSAAITMTETSSLSVSAGNVQCNAYIFSSSRLIEK